MTVSLLNGCFNLLLPYQPLLGQGTYPQHDFGLTAGLTLVRGGWLEEAC